MDDLHHASWSDPRIMLLALIGFLTIAAMYIAWDALEEARKNNGRSDDFY